MTDMDEGASPTMPAASEENSFSQSGESLETETEGERDTSPLFFQYANDELEETAFPDWDDEESLSIDFDPSQLIQDVNIEIRKTSEYFVALQKWEGYVTEVSDDTFSARLIQIKGQGGDQEAEIFLQELDESDRKLVEPGAVFYWSIGYDDRPSGRQRASRIRFRRLPTWSAREIARAKKDAGKIESLLSDGE